MEDGIARFARVRQRRGKKYGLETHQVELRLRAAKAECQICHKGKQLLFDHDHKTGRFRGFLCYGCNQALGLFADNPQLLRNAIDYLERTNGRCVGWIYQKRSPKSLAKRWLTIDDEDQSAEHHS